MLKILRFLGAVLMIFWAGMIVTIFIVAQSLFGNWSEQVANRDVAAEILTPIFRVMHFCGWIAIALVLIIHVIMIAITGARFVKPMVLSILLLALAFGSSLYSGLSVQARTHDLRTELKKEFGSYDAAPKDDARKREFGKLHGMSMMIALLDIALALGCAFCVTQLMVLEPPPRSVEPVKGVPTGEAA